MLCFFLCWPLAHTVALFQHIILWDSVWTVSQQSANTSFFLSSEQLIIYQVGVLPSHFYNVLADKDYSSFRSLLSTAMMLIFLNSTVSWRSCGRWQKLVTITAKEYQKSQRSKTPGGHSYNFSAPGIWSFDSFCSSGMCKLSCMSFLSFPFVPSSASDWSADLRYW